MKAYSPPKTSGHSSLVTNGSPTRKRAQAIRDAMPLLNARKRCQQIWKALQSADYKKEGVLNDAALSILLKSQSKAFSEMLLVKTVEDLLELLDEDQDGALNEDEQILIFSAIKERMEVIAYRLCDVQEYRLFKSLLNEVRSLEADILKYQEHFRQVIGKQELREYRDIGQSKLNKFRNYWQQLHQTCQQESNQKKSLLVIKQQDEMQECKTRYFTPAERSRIKPPPRIRELELQVKLLAANERVEEAAETRREVARLKQEDEVRANRILLAYREKQKQALKLQQERERLHSDITIESQFNALKIRHQSERNRLQKEVKLHFNQLVKNQKIASKLAMNSAVDEARRMRKQTKTLGQYLAEHKQTRTKSLERSPSGGKSIASLCSGILAPHPLKEDVKNMRRFRIKSRDDVPVNVGRSNSLAEKNQLILARSRRIKPGLPSLSSLYDCQLQLVG